MCRRRSLVVPTWRGCLLLLALGILVGGIAMNTLYPLLAITDPLDTEILVVEGWLPDYALDQIVAEFEQGDYHKLYTTGGPLRRGAPLAEYGDYAALSAASLTNRGLSAAVVQAVPAPQVPQDRTYTSAVALRDWLMKRGEVPEHLNLMSLSTHSRRSRLLFEKAFGGSVQIGIITIESQDFDPKRWWRSSQGVREVLGELIAYTYVRLFFLPAEPERSSTRTPPSAPLRNEPRAEVEQPL